jgi:ribosomal protein S18 acetylase RimI-like enzyme
MQLYLKELTIVTEMLKNIELMRFLYPDFPLEKYESYLNEMILHNYKQLAVYDNDSCVAITGFWTGTKLWSGKFIEIDNFIVHPQHRSKGLGKMMTDYIDVKAKKEGCSMIVLDAYTDNFTAHRFYYNQGYVPRGFHFLKIIDKDGLS